MTILDLKVPGHRPEYISQEISHKILSPLMLIRSRFFEANVALNLFEAANGRPIQIPTSEQLAADAARRLEMRREIEEGAASPPGFLPWGEQEAARAAIDYEVDAQFHREAWSQGRLPRAFQTHELRIHAKGFMYAIDTIDKVLAALIKDLAEPEATMQNDGFLVAAECVAPKLQALRDQLVASFPDMRGVRDTSQHIEDRSRGLGRPGQPPLDPQPISTPEIFASGGGNLFIENLINNRFGSVKADGSYGEVEVSAASLHKLRDVVQGVLDSFAWAGGPRYEPSL